MECDIDAYIPASYIKNEYQKLDIYKRISGIENNEECLDMQDELMDRFGEIPRSVENLLAVAVLKAQANRAGVTEVKINRQEVRLTMHPSISLNTAEIPRLVASYRGALRFRTDRVPYFHYTDTQAHYKDCTPMMDKAREILEELEKMRG